MSTGAEGELPNDIKILCVVAIARTGCTHMLRLFRHCPEFNVKGEMFHRAAAVGQLTPEDWTALTSASGGEVKDVDSLCDWRSENPGLTLDTLVASGGNRVLVAKLAPGHLRKTKIEEGILAREDVGYIVLRRRPIESYISGLKAREIGRYAKVDTTHLTPSLEAPEFLDWAERTRAWCDWFAGALKERDRPTVELTYERNLEHLSNVEALAGILSRLEAIGLRRVALPDDVKARERQDREPDYRKRVANWQEFEARLSGSPAGADLLAWAQAAE